MRNKKFIRLQWTQYHSIFIYKRMQHLLHWSSHHNFFHNFTLLMFAAPLFPGPHSSQDPNGSIWIAKTWHSMCIQNSFTFCNLCSTNKSSYNRLSKFDRCGRNNFGSFSNLCRELRRKQYDHSIDATICKYCINSGGISIGKGIPQDIYWVMNIGSCWKTFLQNSMCFGAQLRHFKPGLVNKIGTQYPGATSI